jgi:hypothetical protein
MLSYLAKHKSFGPKSFSFNSYVSLIDQDFSRKVVLLRHGDFTRENINKILNGKVYGMVVVTPSNKSVILPKDWIENYNYLSEKSPLYPVYFVDTSSDIETVINQLETEKRRSHIKLITTDVQSKLSPKATTVDFIGELKKDFASNYQYIRSSTILLSAMDTLTVNTDTTENFTQEGSGLLAGLSISRTLSHFIKQFKEPVHNLIYYFCGTGFDNYVSFTNFLGNNENTHFTTGLKQVIFL